MESSDKHFCKMNGIRFLNTKGKVHGNPKNNGSLFEKLLGFHVGITFYDVVCICSVVMKTMKFFFYLICSQKRDSCTRKK